MVKRFINRLKVRLAFGNWWITNECKICKLYKNLKIYKSANNVFFVAKQTLLEYRDVAFNFSFWFALSLPYPTTHTDVLWHLWIMIVLNCKILLHDILISISRLGETLCSRREPFIVSRIFNSTFSWAQSNIKNVICLESSFTAKLF